MTFVVVWDSEIAADIDSAIAASIDARQLRIAEAVAELNDLLTTKAPEVGESREAGLVRVVTEPPLTIHFRVTDRLRLVRVFAVAIYGR